MTNEAEGVIAKCIADKKIEYPIAIVPGGELDKTYGVEGFPSAWLVGPKGDVIWAGHPGNLDEGTIETALNDASFVPDVPEKYREINGAIAKKDYGKAHGLLVKELAKGEQEALAKCKAAIEKVAQDRFASASKAGEGGDYAEGAAILADMGREFKGLPAEKEAAQKLKEWKADKSISAQIKAGADMKRAETLEKLGDPAARKKAYSIYADLAKRFKGSPLGDRAQAAAERVKG